MIGGQHGSRRSSCGSALRLLALDGNILAGREKKMPDIPEVESQVTLAGLTPGGTSERVLCLPDPL